MLTWTRKWWPYAALTFAALIAVTAICTSPAYQSCKAEYRQDAAEKQQKEGPSTLIVRVIRSGWTSVKCSVESVDAIEGFLTLLATIAIAIFTLTIWRVNRSQLQHAHKVERAYVSGGGAPIMRETRIQRDRRGLFPGNVTTTVIEPVFEPTGEFGLTINNYGKTPGEIFEYGVGWCEATQIPDQPIYEWTHHHDWAAPGVGSRPLKNIKIPTEKYSRLAIFGRFRYQDIFGNPHSDGFIQEGDRPLLAPKPYTESDPPWDMPEVKKWKYKKPAQKQGEPGLSEPP